jgi:hypothetical protein
MPFGKHFVPQSTSFLPQPVASSFASTSTSSRASVVASLVEASSIDATPPQLEAIRMKNNRREARMNQVYKQAGP